MRVTKRQLRRLVREATASSHEYALAYVDSATGDRRVELVVREEDAELARRVMKAMRRQGQVSGVQPTRGAFDPRVVTTRDELLRMLGEGRNLWDNIRAKRARGERPAKPGDEGYPSAEAWEAAQESRRRSGASISEEAGRNLGYNEGEGRHTRAQLFQVAEYAAALHEMLRDDDDLPEWVQTKIATMTSDIDKIKHYLEYKILRMEASNEDY